MRTNHCLQLACVALACGLALAAEPAAQPTATTTAPATDTLYVSGPFTSGNLSVYILCRRQGGAAAGRTDYLTVEEALRKGLVKIVETGRGQVDELEVTSETERPVFIHAGEIISGGKQDRVVRASMVVPARVIDMTLPVLCAEQARWDGDKAFSSLGLVAPSREMRLTNLAGEQDKFWRAVAQFKARAAAPAGLVDKAQTSALGEEYTAKDFQAKVEKLRKELAEAVKAIGAGKDGNKPVGMAYAIGADVCAADYYGDAELFGQLWPMLLRSAAADAVTRAAVAASPAPTAPATSVPPAVPAAVTVPTSAPGTAASATTAPTNSTPAAALGTPLTVTAVSAPTAPAVPTAQEVSRRLSSLWDGEKQEERLSQGNVWLKTSASAGRAGQLYYQRQFVHSHIALRPADPQPKTRPVFVPERQAED
jgi:hypothetical protein